MGGKGESIKEFVILLAKHIYTSPSANHLLKLPSMMKRWALQICVMVVALVGGASESSAALIIN